jgi:hypothetical protein
MKLWISAELDGDVAEKHQAAWKTVQEAINRRLKGHKFTSPWKSWDFISVIMSDRGFYEEVAKKSKKDKSLEFRLKIDHAKFLKASQKQANKMLLEALARSVEKMAKMEVTDEDVEFLKATLAEVAAEI